MNTQENLEIVNVKTQQQSEQDIYGAITCVSNDELDDSLIYSEKGVFRNLGDKTHIDIITISLYNVHLKTGYYKQVVDALVTEFCKLVDSKKQVAYFKKNTDLYTKSQLTCIISILKEHGFVIVRGKNMLRYSAKENK